MNQPLFFLPNRVWRCYTGGALLGDCLGKTEADDHFPEDWLASVTPALNGENQQHPDEGLSRVRLANGSPGPLLRDLLRDNARALTGAPKADTLGVLCKFLDSAVRLPVQCHPDREFARLHFNSPFGKEESWLILNTRRINGEDPYLLLGFRPGVTRDQFVSAVRRQDIPAMVACFNRIPVRAGDGWMIPGRFPHAIGPGVFMLEVQEPSDWVVQPEPHCAGTPLSPADQWGPLTPEIALDCFRYETLTPDEIRRRYQLRPLCSRACGPTTIETIIQPGANHSFQVDRVRLQGSLASTELPGWHIGVVTEGSGEIRSAEQTWPLTRGAVFLLPHQARATYVAPTGLQFYAIKGIEG